MGVVVLMGTWCSAREFPGPAPGPARAEVNQDELVLENEVIALRWTVADGRLRPAGVANKPANKTLLFRRRTNSRTNISGGLNRA